MIREPAPLVSIPIFTTEAAIISVGRPTIDIDIRYGILPIDEVIAHLRRLAPLSVVVVPADPAARNAWDYAVAVGQILGACAALGIATEIPPRITGSRTWH